MNRNSTDGVRFQAARYSPRFFDNRRFDRCRSVASGACTMTAPTFIFFYGLGHCIGIIVQFGQDDIEIMRYPVLN